ncbi:MAG: SUMF1/EgtB/PvdO family nonheme iron enzyme [Bacteroidetes bacterium]|nr:SUMF1/EgtB/PvdO family nonheme iron enzyme [Bacteroidota bacterium]
MVSVKGGSFQMGYKDGYKDEGPVHKVTLSDFSIAKYEVTFAEFKKFVDATGYVTDAEQPDSVNKNKGLPPRGRYNGTWKQYMSGAKVPYTNNDKPVGNVSWNDAMAYCKWLSSQTGQTFSLPTEAEWEFAARGGVKSKGYKFAGSNVLDEVAWYSDNSSSELHRCGQKMANELGIYDMSGNIREWCADWYGEFYYKESPELSPRGPERGKYHIVRGGSWSTGKDRMRTTFRNYEFPYNSALDYGFRVAIPGAILVEAVKPVETKAADSNNMFKDLDAKGMLDIYGIYFDIGKSVVKPESYPVIDQLVTYLNNHPKLRVEIEGHTDNTGNADANLILSDKRAESIKAEIVKRGIDAGRLETKGYGASRPIADNKTTAGRTQNRRVTIKKL